MSTPFATMRETLRGRRVRHSSMGMVTAWIVTQGVWLVVMIILLSTERMSQGRDPLEGVLFFGITALYSAAVCFAAWLVIGLPAYWNWPRTGFFWTPWTVIVLGAMGGGFVTVLVLDVVVEIPWIIVIPAAIGAISAFDAWRREERFLRNKLLLISRASPIS